MYRLSQSHFTPNGRRRDFGITGSRSSLRISAEPIQNCRIDGFRKYLKALFSLAYKNPSAASGSLTEVIPALLLAKDRRELQDDPVELLSCKPLDPHCVNPDSIFIIEVGYRPRKPKPHGVPFTGTYQGSIRHFTGTLFP